MLIPSASAAAALAAASVAAERLYCTAVREEWCFSGPTIPHEKRSERQIGHYGLLGGGVDWLFGFADTVIAVETAGAAEVTELMSGAMARPTPILIAEACQRYASLAYGIYVFVMSCPVNCGCPAKMLAASFSGSAREQKSTMLMVRVIVGMIPAIDMGADSPRQSSRERALSQLPR